MAVFCSSCATPVRAALASLGTDKDPIESLCLQAGLRAGVTYYVLRSPGRSTKGVLYPCQPAEGCRELPAASQIPRGIPADNQLGPAAEIWERRCTRHKRGAHLPMNGHQKESDETPGSRGLGSSGRIDSVPRHLQQEAELLSSRSSTHHLKPWFSKDR